MIALAGFGPVHVIDPTREGFNLSRLLSVLLDGRRIEIHPGHPGDDQGNGGNGTDDPLLLATEVLVGEDEDDQGQEGDDGDDHAQLVLDEEAGLVLLGGRVQAVGLFPQHIPDDGKDEGSDDQADQPAHFHGWLAKHQDGPDLDADGDDPGEDGDDAQVPGLALAFGRGDKARAAR